MGRASPTGGGAPQGRRGLLTGVLSVAAPSASLSLRQLTSPLSVTFGDISPRWGESRPKGGAKARDAAT